MVCIPWALYVVAAEVKDCEYGMAKKGNSRKAYGDGTDEYLGYGVGNRRLHMDKYA
jgi:hypothetical protein